MIATISSEEWYILNILLTLAFDGRSYHGFQVQENAPTVCAALQDGMERLFGERPPVKGCSRTDAGVSARAFRLSFHSGTAIPLERLPLALNHHLPPDIRVRGAQAVPDDFHARYSALGKAYQYRFLNAATDDPLDPFCHRVSPLLDEAAMDAAGQALLGRHDFAAFCSSGSGVADTIRTIQSLRVTRDGERVTLAIAADGFLYNMVRIIAGTLLRLGAGQEDGGYPARARASGRRGDAGDTLPAAGLILDRVFYPPELELD